MSGARVVDEQVDAAPVGEDRAMQESTDLSLVEQPRDGVGQDEEADQRMPPQQARV